MLAKTWKVVAVLSILALLSACLPTRTQAPEATSLAPTPTLPSPSRATETPRLGPGPSQRRCGDGVCDGPENAQNCPQDCPAVTTATASPSPCPTAEAGPLPDVLAELSLAPAGESLTDLLLDRALGRVYVTDTAGQLHVLDAADYTEVASLPASGRLVLDSANQRLYASPDDETGQLAIIDTGQLTVVGEVSPSGFVTVDRARSRFYVGNRLEVDTAEDAPGIRIYDGLTMEKLGEIPQPGIPVYNPLRDELYIVAYTVYTVSLETLEITGDLFPELMTQPFLWCSGCQMVRNLHIFSDHNLLMAEMRTLMAGHGPGRHPSPRFFDATTLAELTELADVPTVGDVCQEQVVLAEPVDGQVYRGETYSHYRSYSNLLVYDLDGKLITWLDGMPLGITNPNTKQMYIPYVLGVLVLDLATLSPIGTLPSVTCFDTLDADGGRVYAIDDENLIVFVESGRAVESFPAAEVEGLPTSAIRLIKPSPDYENDQTVFVRQGGQLYRSRDGGSRWALLRGGLPSADDSLVVGLTISPDFANDRTLFGYSYRWEAWGDGIYRSTDGGDTWQPVWEGLTHLRVYDVIASRDYAADGTLVAYADYQRIEPWEEGYSLFRSTDRGLSWTLAMTQSGMLLPPPPEDLLSLVPEPDIRFRKGYDEADNALVERTTDGGETWKIVFVLPPSESYTMIQEVLTSPSFATDQTVYVLDRLALFRSTDAGETWQSWADERLVGRDYSNELTGMATSPALENGQHLLFIGTAAGEFWSLDPATVIWEPVSLTPD